MIQQFRFWVCTWKKQSQHCIFTVTLLTIAKIQKRKYPSRDDRIKKTVNTYNGILFSHKKETLPSVATQMNLEGIVRRESSHGEKDIFW